MEDIKNQNFTSQEEINKYFAFRQEQINKEFEYRENELEKVVILIHSLNFVLTIFTLCAIYYIQGYDKLYVFLFQCIAGYGIIKLNSRLCKRVNTLEYKP